MDPTPYAAPTDLRTAEDVAEWLRKKTFVSASLRATSDALDARIDRERRQACRRGCFAMFREACREREWERDARKLFDDGVTAALRRGFRAHYLRCALAFRAAARAR